MNIVYRKDLKMAKKIKRHIIKFRMAFARVWAEIEDAQMKRAQWILKNHRHWE